MHAHLYIGKVAKRRSAGAVAAVCKVLHGHCRFTAYLAEDRTAERVRRILLVRALLYHYTFIEENAILRICLLRMVRMDSMCIVTADHERPRHCHAVIFF